MDGYGNRYHEKLHQVYLVNNAEDKKPVGIVRIKDVARELVTIND
jgi:hypothetical protein